MIGKAKRPSPVNRASGTPSYGRRFAALSLAALAFTSLVLMAASAFASKEVANYFGSSDGSGNTNLGGEFSGPRDIAVNASGAGGVDGGTIYVVDTGNDRVQRFDSDGNFVSAWGADVVQDGGTGDQGDATAKRFEICTIAAECKAGVASSGNGTAAGNGSLNSPQALAVDPDTGNLYVSDAGNNRVNEYDGTGAFIRSFGWDVVKSGDAGDVPGTDEVQTVSLDPGVDGEFRLVFGSAKTAGIAADASAAMLQSALEGLNAIGAGDVAVSGPAGGPWTVEFTGDLAERDVSQLSVDGDGASTSDGLSSPVGTVFTCASPTVADTTAYQWLSNGAPATGPGADTDTYTTVAADAGKPVQCQVFKINANGGSTQTSKPVEMISPLPSEGREHVSSVRNPIPDNPSAGSEMFDCTPSGWAPGLTLSHQWYRNGAPIAGATDEAYTLQASDVPGVIQCVVVGTRGDGIAVASASGNTVTAGGIGTPAPPGGSGCWDCTPTVTTAGAASGAVTTPTVGVNGGMEVCEGAAACRRGTSGSGAGQIGETSSAGTLGLAASPDGAAGAGTVYLADSGNQRVNTYDLDGANPDSFGSATEFGADQPRKVAVDSRGIVYASDSQDGGEIERYDTVDANSTGIGFLDPITATDSGVPGPLLAGSDATATAGLAVHPDSDGGLPNDASDEDVLYVLRDPSSGNTAVQQFGPVNDPGLAAASAAVDDSHGATAGFSAVNGLGLNDADGRLFVSSTSTVSGVSGHRVYILADTVAPAATLDPITIFDAHSATFSGTVDPNGSQTRYRFEYVDAVEFAANGFTNATKIPIADVNLGAGTDPIDVEQETPHHLVASTTYHVRLVSQRVFAPTQTIGGPLTFTTPGSAPSFHADATDIGTDTATLRAAINPENEAVSDYQFNWGATDSYGNTTPAGNLAQGSAPVAVAEELSGLDPGQTYHYQLVATNATGTTTGPDRTFATPAGPPQFPNRAYELVSQNPTGGVPLIPTVLELDVSEDGDRGTFDNLNPLPGSEFPISEHGGGAWMYQVVRGSDGWKVISAGMARNMLAYGSGVSLDGMRIFTMAESGLDPDDQNGKVDMYQRQPDGSFVWISRDPRVPAGTPQTAPGAAYSAGGFCDGYVAKNEGTSNTFTMSADGRTIVFCSDRSLDDADPGRGDPSQLGGIYKWQDGQLSFIGRRPDGSRPNNSQLVNLASGRRAVARDGSHVVFRASRDAAGVNAGTLFVQTDGEPTVEAVKETGVAPLAVPQPYNVTYRDAAADGSRVFFTSASRLTPDSGASASSGPSAAADLYVYDLAADKVRDLTPRLDGIADPSVDPATADRARAQGVVVTSEDGRTVYFVADARYDTAPNPEGELPSAAGLNLYQAELDGIDDPIELRFVAALGVGDPEDAFAWRAVWRDKRSHSSPDASVVSFASSEDLVAGRATGGSQQLYAYDAGAGRLDCASCPGDGSLPASEVNPLPSTPGGLSFGRNWQLNYGEMRWVADDGAVFFYTSTQLLPADQNSADDVYEYRGGELRLVSDGAGTNDSLLENISRDGASVFFTTGNSLIPQDKEPGITKIYVARKGGGCEGSLAGTSACPPPPEPPCDLSAGACEGEGTSPPELPGAATPAIDGPENPQPNLCGRFNKLAKRKLRIAKRAAKRGQQKRARALRRGARKLRRRAKRCDRRQAR